VPFDRIADYVIGNFSIIFRHRSKLFCRLQFYQTDIVCLAQKSLQNTFPPVNNRILSGGCGGGGLIGCISLSFFLLMSMQKYGLSPSKNKKANSLPWFSRKSHVALTNFVIV